MRFYSPANPRKSNVALSVFVVLLLLFGLTLADAAWHARAIDHAASRALVRELGLSDLSLFTEARYTRHPSQAPATLARLIGTPHFRIIRWHWNIFLLVRCSHPHPASLRASTQPSTHRSNT